MLSAMNKWIFICWIVLFVLCLVCSTKSIITKIFRLEEQLTDLVMENGSDFLGIPLDGKREILLGLHEASAIELPDDWEGATPVQIMKQLASSWRIDLQRLIN